MTAWLIMLFVLGPLLVFTGWVVIRQLRGGFDGPEPEQTEPDFLQRHAWLAAWLVLALMALRIGGPSGFFAALLAGAILFVFLALLGSLLATVIESAERPSSDEEKCLSEFGPPSSASDSPDNRFHRRYLRNLRRAAKEGPRFWG